MYSDFQLRIVKPKLLLRLITKGTDNPVNQSKLSRANTRSRRKARESVREQVTIGLGSASDWLRINVALVFKRITERSNTKPTEKQITFETQEGIV